jgi:hypothetical protein
MMTTETDTATAPQAGPPPAPKRAEPLIPLATAIRMIKADPQTAWMPYWTLRQAVSTGRVFSRRSSEGKYARYYVRLSELRKALLP